MECLNPGLRLQLSKNLTDTFYSMLHHMHIVAAMVTTHPWPWKQTSERIWQLIHLFKMDKRKALLHACLYLYIYILEKGGGIAALQVLCLWLLSKAKSTKIRGTVGVLGNNAISLIFQIDFHVSWDMCQVRFSSYCANSFYMMLNKLTCLSSKKIYLTPFLFAVIELCKQMVK